MSNDIIKRLTKLEKENQLMKVDLQQLNTIVNQCGNLLMQQTQINAKLIQATDLAVENIQLKAEQAEQ